MNKSFEKKLINELELSKGNSFLSLGSCPLHTANNGFGEGMKNLKVIVDIEQFLIDVHFFFSCHQHDARILKKWRQSLMLPHNTY